MDKDFLNILYNAIGFSKKRYNYSNIYITIIAITIYIKKFVESLKINISTKTGN